MCDQVSYVVGGWRIQVVSKIFAYRECSRRGNARGVGTHCDSLLFWRCVSAMGIHVLSVDATGGAKWKLGVRNRDGTFGRRRHQLRYLDRPWVSTYFQWMRCLVKKVLIPMWAGQAAKWKLATQRRKETASLWYSIVPPAIFQNIEIVDMSDAVADAESWCGGWCGHTLDFFTYQVSTNRNN